MVDVILNRDVESNNLGEILGVDIFVKEGIKKSDDGGIEAVKPVSVIINSRSQSNKEALFLPPSA